ncbi:MULTISPECIES: S9 family peptidase [unclassified Cupriavidus]|uniref:alpha/beta hydrolase family protein n=1 Tax=unclassified Cupriavidus TaxID=2640874 RepID=UPI000406F889|nr:MULTISPECIES: alpha/beta fold hydrolase [unclassified Cupriavidus]
MATHEELLQIQSEGGTIAGTLISPQTRLPGVLFVHGWGGSQQQYLARARKVAGLGCVCLTFDLTGHAGTRSQYETVTRMRNLADVVAAYDTLVRQPEVDRNAIAVVGSSYGGYLAALLSAMRPVRWMGFRAPALYMDSGWELPKRQLHREQDLVAYRRSVVPPEDNRAVRACAEFGGDVLVIESEHDQVVPHAAVMSYVDACVHANSMTYRVIKGADHGLTDEESQRAYSSLLVNWLREMVTVARAGPVSADSAVEPKPRPAAPEPDDELVAMGGAVPPPAAGSAGAPPASAE